MTSHRNQVVPPVEPPAGQAIPPSEPARSTPVGVRVRGTGLRDAGVTLGISAVVNLGLVAYAGLALTHGAAAIAGIGLVAVAAFSVAARQDRWSGPADRITLGRTVLVGGCATIAVLALVGVVGPRPWWIVALAVPALLLDGIDGWVARRTGTANDAGARLDMEVDAALILVLAAVAALTVGPWVLLIGAARYLWILAGYRLPALRRTPRFRYSRKVIAVVQSVALIVALIPVVPVPVATAGLVVALGLLLFSFGRDARDLFRADPSRADPSRADPSRADPSHTGKATRNG